MYIYIYTYIYIYIGFYMIHDGVIYIVMGGQPRSAYEHRGGEQKGETHLGLCKKEIIHTCQVTF